MVSKISKYDFYSGRYCPPSIDIANGVHYDLDLYFQCHNISGNCILNIWKKVKAIEKCSNTTHINVDIDLNVYFQGRNISGYHIIHSSWKTMRASEKNVPFDFGCRLIFVIEWRKSSFSAIWPWLNFAKSKVKSYISHMVRVAPKYSLWL